MATLQQQIADLRKKLQALPMDARSAEIAPLEAEARALLTASKNTQHEDEAKQLFAEIARRSAPPSADVAAQRGLLRRARIRMEMAGGDEDFDEAIDILAQVIDQDPHNTDVLALLRQAAGRSSQHEARVRDLLARYGQTLDIPATGSLSPSRERTTTITPAVSTPTIDASLNALDETDGQTSHSEPTSSASVNGASDKLLADLAQSYYEGEYQRTVDLANRVLNQQPDNATAQDYRAKAEDNLIRGIVPDHRIPFDARVAYNRANSLVRAGNYEEAERLYREARDIAERAGITSWKDAEQALLEIQDLALARELLADGDRLLAGDDWTGALRKYEGALRVVSADPVVQERIELVRRVQEQHDKASVQLNMMSGTLTDRVTNLQNVLKMLAVLRQTLPSSTRLQMMSQEADKRLSEIKAQLLDQGKAAFARIEGATVLEEKGRLTAEAVKLLETAASVDPGDKDISQTLQQARQIEAQVSEARQVIERTSALIAQNFDAELGQARSMLSGLRQFAQDPRYRMIVSDLMSRHMERIEAAIDNRDVPTAERWLALAKDEPFRMLGRRSELLQLEDEIRKMQRGRTMRGGLLLLVVFALLGIAAFLSRDMWLPVVNNVLNPPTPTMTYTPTNTPTLTPTASDTPTATLTYTPSMTPTATYTPTYTSTPTFTFTPSITPTSTNTPTATLTPSVTNTPSMTPTPAILCIVLTRNNGTIIRTRPDPKGQVLVTLNTGHRLEVLRIQGGSDGRVWYFTQFIYDDLPLNGWVRFDAVEPLQSCPGVQ